MKKYLNTISAFQFFQLLRYSTLILVGIIFTKTTLSQAAIGEYETFVFMAGAVSFFWLNGLLKALLPLSAEKREKTFFSAFILIQFFSILAALFLYLLQPFFSEFLLNDKAIPEMMLLLVFIVFGVPANLVEYYYLIKKQNKAILIYGSVSFFIQFVLIVLPILFGFGIQMALKGLVLSSLLKYVWLWIIFVFNQEICFSKDFLKAHLQLGGPLIVATFLSGSAQFVDGFIVTSKFNEETFAVFRYGARELPLAVLLANALSSAMLPSFASMTNLQENLQQLKSSVSKLMHILFPLTAVFLIVSKPLFPILFNPLFAESATIFNIYLLLVISRLLMPQTILTGLKLSRPIMMASFLELLLNVLLSLVFVQLWGIAGIAMATFVAYLFEKIYLALVVVRKLNIRLSDYLSFRIYLAYSLGTIVIFIFTELIF